MSIIEELSSDIMQTETLLTIGVFDGVHIGHQHLLNYLINKARDNGWLSGVITFKFHPQTVISPGSKLVWLDDLDTRIGLMRILGIDRIIAITFTDEVRRFDAREFAQLLKDNLKMCGLVIGPDFAFGKDRRGDAAQLRALGQEMGFSIDIVSPVIIDNEVVSSSAIRQALNDGDMKKAERFLGRVFSLSGQIVPGDQRGRVLGFPTVNLDVSPEQATPGNGVYATFSDINGESMPSVTNIGIRPTFGGGKRQIETYVIDYEQQIREQNLKLDFIDKLRDERHFDSVEDLQVQIREDIKQAKLILNNLVQN
jgi:riboflavin kinase/FMN adenylyltransferase